MNKLVTNVLSKVTKPIAKYIDKVVVKAANYGYKTTFKGFEKLWGPYISRMSRVVSGTLSPLASSSARATAKGAKYAYRTFYKTHPGKYIVNTLMGAGSILLVGGGIKKFKDIFSKNDVPEKSPGEDKLNPTGSPGNLMNLNPMAATAPGFKSVVQSQSKSDQTQLQVKLAEAKSGRDYHQKVMSGVSIPNQSSPDTLQKIYSTKADPNDKMDKMIELLNQQANIQNDSRKLNLMSLKLEVNKAKAESDKATQLYNSLVQLQIQSNSANKDAIKSLNDASVKSNMMMAKSVGSSMKSSSTSLAKTTGKLGAIGLTSLAIFDLIKNNGKGIGTALGAIHDGIGHLTNLIGSTLGAGVEDTPAKMEDALGSIDKDITRRYKSEFDKSPKSSEVDKTSGSIDLDKLFGKDETGRKPETNEFGQKVGAAASLVAERRLLREARKQITNDTEKVASEKIAKAASEATEEKIARDAALKQLQGTGDKKAIKSAEELSRIATRNRNLVRYYQKQVESGKMTAAQAEKAIAKGTKSMPIGEGLLSKSIHAVESIRHRPRLKQVIIGRSVNRVKDKIKAVKSIHTMNKNIARTTKAAIQAGKAVAKGGGLKGTVKGVRKASAILAKRIATTLAIRQSSKMAKAIPGIGLGIGAFFAIKRALAGDWKGAALEITGATLATIGDLAAVATGGASAIVGNAAMLGCDAINMKRDIDKCSEFAETGNVRGLMDQCDMSVGDLIELIYGISDDNPSPIDKDHPLRRAFESSFKKIDDVFDLRADNKVDVLAMIAKLPDDTSLKKDLMSNYSTLDNLMSKGISFSDSLAIAEVIGPNSRLFEDVINTSDPNLISSIEPDSSAWNGYTPIRTALRLAINNPETEFGKSVKSTYTNGSLQSQLKEYETKSNSFKSRFAQGTSKFGRSLGNTLAKTFDVTRWGTHKKLATGVDSSGRVMYASGTGSHKGGKAVVGDGHRSEVILTPDGKAYLSKDTPQEVNLPSGTKVIPSVESVESLGAKDTTAGMQQLPKYASGTDVPKFSGSDKFDPSLESKGKGEFEANVTRANKSPLLRGGHWNVEDSLRHLNTRSHSSSTGKCALGVRTALEAGGFSTNGRPNSASEYHTKGYMYKLGFAEVPKVDGKFPTSPEPGDIVIEEATGSHKYGHIQMWDGSKWISDFRQNGLNIHRRDRGEMHLYRFPSTKMRSIVGKNWDPYNLEQMTLSKSTGANGNSEMRSSMDLNKAISILSGLSNKESRSPVQTQSQPQDVGSADKNTDSKPVIPIINQNGGNTTNNTTINNYISGPGPDQLMEQS